MLRVIIEFDIGANCNEFVTFLNFLWAKINENVIPSRMRILWTTNINLWIEVSLIVLFCQVLHVLFCMLLFTCISRASDWPRRRRLKHQSSRWRCLGCWARTTCSCRTTIHHRCTLRHSCRHHSYRSHGLQCRTDDRWNLHLPVSTPSSRCRRLRCIRPPSAYSVWPHHWWRTSSIQPSTTGRQYARSTRHITYENRMLLISNSAIEVLTI